MTVRLLFAATAIVLALAFLHPGQSAAPATRSSPQVTLVRPPMAPDVLPELRRLRAEVANLAEAQLGLEEELADLPPPPRPLPTEEDVERSLLSTVAGMEAHLSGEPKDPEWSEEAERSLRGGLSGLGDTIARVAEVTCRASMCRIEVEVSADAEAGMVTERMVEVTPWPANTFFQVSPAERRAVLYVAREGQTLPGQI